MKMPPQKALQMKNKRCIVTGGCGFIGSGLVLFFVIIEGVVVLVVDKLTYAGVADLF